MELHRAVLWEPKENEAVQCALCHFRCRIAPGQRGRCNIRENVEGELYTLTYHAVCATNVDAIEKKPLFHYQPGKRSFSIATMGCNFRCDFCQNWQISQYARQHGQLQGKSLEPADIVEAARKIGASSIAYTYTEPTMFYELAEDCGIIAREQGLGNVFVSNGYMTQETLERADSFLDAINVDLKSFQPAFYRDCCHAELKPVLNTLRYIAQKTDIWLEITTLVIPDLNDSESELREIAKFIAGECGPHVPWHISRFHPQYERESIAVTPAETLENAYEIGKEEGLRYVYVGNLPTQNRQSTFCHQCGHLLIERYGYQIRNYNLMAGKCNQCQTPLAGKDLDPAQL